MGDTSVIRSSQRLSSASGLQNLKQNATDLDDLEPHVAQKKHSTWALHYATSLLSHEHTEVTEVLLSRKKSLRPSNR